CRAARAIKAVDPEEVARHPEFLALHLTEGGLAEEAAAHWLEAARRSLARSALPEATHLLQRGLEPLETLPASEQNGSLRLQLGQLRACRRFRPLHRARRCRPRDLSPGRLHPSRPALRQP